MIRCWWAKVALLGDRAADRVRRAPLRGAAASGSRAAVLGSRAAVLVAVLLALVVSFCVGIPSAEAERIDASVAQTLVVGKPVPRTGAAAPFPLPARPSVAWQARLQGNVAHAPAVALDGRLVVASTGRVSEFDPKGKLRWSYRIKGATAACPPAIAPDGSRVVLTSRSELVVLSDEGKLRHRKKLPLSTRSGVTTPLVTRTNLFVVAAGRRVLLTDLQGTVLASTETSEEVLGIAEWGRYILITSNKGLVERWRPGVDLRKVGMLSEHIQSFIMADDDHLLARIGTYRLVELELTRGSKRVRAADNKLSFVGQPVITPSGTAHVATQDGLVVGFDARGKETRRVLLAPIGVGANLAGAPPHLLLGADGQIAFALPTGEVGVIHRDGTVKRTATTVCRSPEALVSVERKRFAAVCASGLVVGIGEAPPSESEEPPPPKAEKK